MGFPTLVLNPGPDEAEAGRLITVSYDAMEVVNRLNQTCIGFSPCKSHP